MTNGVGICLIHKYAVGHMRKQDKLYGVDTSYMVHTKCTSIWCTHKLHCVHTSYMTYHIQTFPYHLIACTKWSPRWSPLSGHLLRTAQVAKSQRISKVTFKEVSVSSVRSPHGWKTPGHFINPFGQRFAAKTHQPPPHPTPPRFWICKDAWPVYGDITCLSHSIYSVTCLLLQRWVPANNSGKK